MKNFVLGLMAIQTILGIWSTYLVIISQEVLINLTLIFLNTIFFYKNLQTLKDERRK